MSKFHYVALGSKMAFQKHVPATFFPVARILGVFVASVMGAAIFIYSLALLAYSCVHFIPFF